MIVIKEMSLTEFNFWSGAKEFAEKLTYTELKELDSVMEDIFFEGIDEVKVNDIFWFDSELVCEWLGLDLEEVLNRG